MPSNPQFSPEQDRYRCRGAFIDLRQLLDQRHVARHLELDYNARTRLGMTGTHISRIKGRGVDFEEHRAYQPGDDIRTIDWRVTARSGRPFTKVFREERERPVIIGVDQSHAMYFGSQVAFKSVVAAEAAAIICWTTVDNGDRVGGVVFGDNAVELVKPRRSKRSALRFLHLLAEYNQQLVHSHARSTPAAGRLKAALQQMCRITKPGSNVYLISDFSDFGPDCQPLIQQLAMHNSMTCVLVHDALEEHLPRPGIYSITDGQARTALDTFSKSVREQYHRGFEQHLAGLRETLTLAKVPLITIRTNELVLDRLETWKQKTH